MKMLRIIETTVPFSGMGIPLQECEYCKTQNGFPSIKVRWVGILFGHREGVFIFGQDSLAAAPLSRLQVKISGFSGAASKYGDRAFAAGLVAGIIANLIAGSVGLMSAKTSNIKGFAVVYLNEKQKQGRFQAIGEPEIVDEIIASIPACKLRLVDDLETL